MPRRRRHVTRSRDDPATNAGAADPPARAASGADVRGVVAAGIAVQTPLRMLERDQILRALCTSAGGEGRHAAVALRVTAWAVGASIAGRGGR